MKKLSTIIHDLSGPIFEKFGVMESQIIINWENVVGSEISKLASPQTIKKQEQQNTLYIETYNSSAALILQHMTCSIISKITSFFGFKAIDSVRINIKRTTTK